MGCSSCAARRKALAELRRAVVSGDRPEAAAQIKAAARSVRIGLANLRRMVRRR
jgi:hypothetical protein